MKTRLTHAELSNLLGQYQRDAMKTALRTEPNRDLLIRANGLAGEFGELLTASYNGASAAEIDSEIADVVWYIAAVADVLGVDLGSKRFGDCIGRHPRFFDTPLIDEHHVIGVVCAIGVVCEFAKKTAGHGREKPIEPVLEALGHIFFEVVERVEDLPALLAANISKLRARHANAGPGGFDPNYGACR